MPKDLSNRVISIIQLKLTLSQEKSSYADAIIAHVKKFTLNFQILDTLVGLVEC